MNDQEFAHFMEPESINESVIRFYPRIKLHLKPPLPLKEVFNRFHLCFGLAIGFFQNI
jgi:hypothetical protein